MRAIRNLSFDGAAVLLCLQTAIHGTLLCAIALR
jgi:hypothetical protein